jgi:hypothetical protein
MSTNTMSTNQEIRAKLESSAGVLPSDDWLTACRAHLQLTNQDTVDDILHQVFHADLRDVVRPLNETIVGQSASSQSDVLRRNLKESSTGSSRLATLPSNFLLLVQVEELLDVSLNAEARFAIGPASPSNPAPIGNQAKRCLKLYMSDGYLPLIHLVGMEVTPIPNLSVQSSAGIKVLLKGSIQIRHGLLQLSPQNTTVLGGHVAALLQVQRQALEQAKKLAGVDKTVRALIGDDAAMQLEEDDEGEAASADVVARPPPAARTQQVPKASSRVPQPPPPQPPPQAQQQAISPTRAQPISHQMQPPPPRTSQPNFQQAPSRPVQALQPAASRSNSEHFALPTGQVDAAPIATALPAVREPFRNNSSSIDARAFRSTIPAPSTKENLSTNLPSSGATNQELPPDVISFVELVDLVQRITCDRTLYAQYQEKVFVVPSKMKGIPLHFNIEKKKKRQKLGSEKSKKSVNRVDKYEYVMAVHFSGPGSDRLITVAVADDLLRPHFQISPAEMRKLSRENRDASDRISQEGGMSVMAALSKLAPWQLTLNWTSDEYFDQQQGIKLDGEIPLLRVLRRHNL